MNIQQNEARSRFEASVDGKLAKLEYQLTGDSIIFIHTEVPPGLSGRGIGGELARAGLEFAHQKGLKVVARCPFVAKYLERHPEAAK